MPDKTIVQTGALKDFVASDLLEGETAGNVSFHGPASSIAALIPAGATGATGPAGATGATGSPSSPSESLQYNDSGSFGAVTGSSWDGTTLKILSVQTNPPMNGGTVAPELAGAGAGNLSNGVYSYKFTYVTTDAGGNPGETTGSAASLTVTVTDNSTDGKVKIPDLVDSIGILANALIQGANIYRTAAGGSTYKKVGIYNDDDFIDNVSDAGRGVDLPSVNTGAMLDGLTTNDPGVFGADVPSALLQGSIEWIAFANPTSKLVAGPTFNLQVPGWNDASGTPQSSGASLVINSGYSTSPAKFIFTSDNLNTDFSGNMNIAGAFTPAKSTVFPDADPHVVGAGYWAGGTVWTRSAG